jgi:hypothetical protein
MDKYVIVPEDVVLLNQNGQRMKRPSGVEVESMKPCAKCGHGTVAELEDVPAYTHLRWLDEFVLSDQRTTGEEKDQNGRKVFVATGYKMVETVAAVRKAFRNARAGDEVRIAKPYWDLIVDIMEKPGSAVPMYQRAQFFDHYAAWMNAKDKPVKDDVL